MARLNFDATQHDTEQTSYEDLPLGVYRFEMTASDIQPNSKGTGTVLKTTLSVIEPAEYEGRKFFANYNIQNNNPKAEEIGQRDFAKLCRATGVQSVEDSEELHGISFLAKLKMGKDSKEKNADGTPTYPARVEIGRYFYPDEGDLPTPAIDDDQPSAPKAANDNRQAAPARAAAPAAAAGGKSRPWGK